MQPDGIYPRSQYEAGVNPEDTEGIHRAERGEFLAAVPPAARATLQKIRQAIRAAAPEAVEGFSYGVPAFRYKDRPVAAYAAAREHCSYFPMSPAVIKAHATLLKGYDLAKGTIRFPVGKPLPAALVRKLVRARMAEIDSGTKG